MHLETDCPMTDPKDRTILVVDDSPPTCQYLKRLLEKKGYPVITGGDGATGARLALENLPDLILLDKEMPGMHGFDVIRILRRHQETSGIPILMISSEMEEVIGMSDRVIVMHEGRLAGELPRTQISEEAVIQLATGRSLP